MKAKSKKQFVNSWNELVKNFNWLVQSAGSIKTMDEIQEVQKQMREVINKVADECYED